MIQSSATPTVRIQPVQIDMTKIWVGRTPSGVNARSRPAATTRTVEMASAVAKARIIHSR